MINKSKNIKEAMKKVEKELYELNDRIHSLQIFKARPEFQELDHINQTLLEAQQNAMLHYSSILGARLKHNQSICDNYDTLNDLYEILNHFNKGSDQ